MMTKLKEGTAYSLFNKLDRESQLLREKTSLSIHQEKNNPLWSKEVRYLKHGIQWYLCRVAILCVKDAFLIDFSKL